MGRLLLAVILGFVAETAYGDGAAHVVQKFDGTGTNTATATFTVQDNWELLWFLSRPTNITILTADGTVVAGIHGNFKGSFYQPKGGTFYLQLNGDHPETKFPWHLLVAEVGSGTTLSAAEAGSMFANTGDPNYAPPATVLPSTSAAPSGADNGDSTNGDSGNGESIENPFGHPAPGRSVPVTPAPAPTPAPPATPAPVVNLTQDQSHALVLIKGDNAEGTGFLIKTPDGPAVLTNIHVIANNPNLKITTYSGALVTVLSTKGASDRDLALLAVQDANYSYLEMAPDISKIVQPGDDVVTPGNSEGGEVMLNTDGKVLGIGPVRIEIDNPIYHGNSGGPVIHTKSGKVLGVVTETMKMDFSTDLDKTPFARRNSAASGSMRYFGLRLDTVSAWVPIDSRRFQIETTFLDQFHEQSRRLDAYINSPNNNGDTPAPGNDASKIYGSDEKIMKANNTFFEQSAGADSSGRLEALKTLVFDLQCVADTDMDQIQNNLDNFYSFDRDRAQDELDYRKALKTELDAIGNNADRLDSLPRLNN